MKTVEPEVTLTMCAGTPWYEGRAAYPLDALEHASCTIVLRNVSGSVTRELARIGTVSQEPPSHVGMGDIPIWLPEWAKADQVLLDAIRSNLVREEEFQNWLSGYFNFHDPLMGFSEKKRKTAFMRRFEPSGAATAVTWTAGTWALRDAIESRTAPHAEEEVRLVFGKLAEVMVKAAPAMFGDLRRMMDGTWVPKWKKV